MNNTWQTEDKCKRVKECGYIEAKEPMSICLSKEVQGVIDYLCEEIKVEWQMLLTGEVTENEVMCTGYYIPKQKVTASNVENLDCIDKAFIEEHKVVATIHSHSNMGVFFSVTDEEYTNMSLIDHHIVCNNRGEMKACSKTILPCGSAFLAESTVTLVCDPIDTVVGIENIEKATFVSYCNSYYGKGSAKYDRSAFNRAYGMEYEDWNNTKDYLLKVKSVDKDTGMATADFE